MTVVVTRNAPERFRGFLASCMLELAPGVYSSPRMTDGVRERVWSVCEEWAHDLPSDGGLLMTWRDKKEPSGQGLRTLGFVRAHIVDVGGLWLARRDDSREAAEA